MATADTVNRVFREFKRYTGDGKPGEPTGAPLPIGDPTSGVHNPKKSELRAAFLDVLTDFIDGIVPDDSVDRTELKAPLSKSINLTVFDFGAAGDGVTNDSEVFAGLDPDTTVVVPGGVFRLSEDTNIAARLEFTGGGRLFIDGADVVIEKDMIASPDAWIFDLATGAVSYPNTDAFPAWYGLTGEDDEDIGLAVNSMLASIPDAGRSIYFPKAYVQQTQISIPQSVPASVRFVGFGAGMRSNIESERTPPAGIGASVTYPSKGGGIRMGQNLTRAFYMAPSTIPTYRRSGLTFEGMTIQGHHLPTVVQDAIYFDGDNDRVSVLDCVLINLSGFGFYGKNVDAGKIEGNFICESNKPIKIDYGIACNIEGNLVNGHPTMSSMDLNNLYHSSIVNNNFVDAATGLLMNQSQHVNVIGNTFTSRFVGAVVLADCNDIRFVGNGIRVPTDLGTSWTAGKDLYPGPTYDPTERPADYGLIRVVGCVHSTFADCNIISYAPVNYAGIVLINGVDNKVMDWNIKGNASNSKLVHAGATGTIIKNVAKSSEMQLLSGTYAVAAEDTQWQWGVSSTASADYTITFPWPYSAPPTVVPTVEYAAPANATINVTVGNVTASSFAVYKRLVTGGAVSAVAGEKVHWMAIGPRF